MIDRIEDLPFIPVAAAMHPDLVEEFCKTYPAFSDIPILVSTTFPNHSDVRFFAGDAKGLRLLIERANETLRIWEEGQR